MSDPYGRVEQRRREFERRRQAEQLQDRQDRLARQRERDREWRGRPATSKASSIGWLIVFGILALVFFSGGQSSNGSNSVTETNVASDEAPAEAVEYANDAVPVARLDQAAAIPLEGNPSEAGQGSSEPQPAPTQPAAASDEVASEQQRAAAIAFNSGQAERWMAGEDTGYAVPSATVAGCRNITISNDADAASSRVVKLCR